ncbi:MBOAT family O-acyltransferase [Epilithonimonas pallida]|uniref:D-alanyl-lipoteichoic acid acyltransferase DltB, MBOAT superfamily n=1 Tax=Epilithonimonas pallida TaxID=373671 RepID=A0ABY1QZU4_9FLAO|nr:MBOAT family O-acyltransferase [Epilithonimonas pallida]SMP90901.1 D-alanyl-lipoteichoic acid acyltransferase DltB, MBOAT superfamily [Epilithonimonas pallida]
MLFNSLSFAIFLPIVFVLYWLTKARRKQNILLMIASYYFYACWDWRFLFLLAFSTFLDYYTGLKIEKSQKKSSKKFWFWLSVGVNLGFLGFFKYYNFFADSFAELFAGFGFQINPWVLKIILPVGISFYTFHGLSYVIDIYKERIKAEKSWIDYALFVSFFPLLVAGPIERATHLLPQIKRERNFSYSNAVDGLRQILWGLFKKMVVADNCAYYANMIFNDYHNYTGVTLIFGAVLFAFQIYGDFSGYSDIALGTARLFGFDLLRNFSYPYFSRDIAEFWRRWHISLSSWFRDYLYIPLGGSKGGNWMRIRNTFIIFIVSGFWHGANWTFIIWGFLNALFIMPSIILKTNRNNLNIVAEGRLFPNFREIIQLIITFSLACFAWIFFRSASVTDAFSYIGRLFSTLGTGIGYPYKLLNGDLKVLIFVVIMLIFEWFMREELHPLRKPFTKLPTIARWVIYFLLATLVLLFAGEQAEFIYFQF